MNGNGGRKIQSKMKGDDNWKKETNKRKRVERHKIAREWIEKQRNRKEKDVERKRMDK